MEGWKKEKMRSLMTTRLSFMLLMISQRILQYNHAGQPECLLQNVFGGS
jgi:hypothetical protein